MECVTGGVGERHGERDGVVEGEGSDGALGGGEREAGDERLQQQWQRLQTAAGATWRDDDEAERSEGLVLEEATRVGRGLPAIEDEE